ncbi:MAG: ThiF family adenylyltransferase [Janthinobacterium lividum]
MARKLFSHSLHRDHRPVTSQQLLDSLQALAQYLGISRLKPLKWDEDRIAIPLQVAVDLPPLGNAAELDIRPQEPVLLVLNRTNYPVEVPRVYPDRLDFPKDRLAHLYIVKDGRPPGFCLVRGDFAEWYANKRLPDVVIRTRNWLRDAASGELTQNGQQFEPLRLEGYRGSISYPYDRMAAVVQADEGVPSGKYAVALFENTAPAEKAPAFRLHQLLTTDNTTAVLAEYVRGMQALAKEAFGGKRYHFGYLAWSPDADTYATYRTDLPRDWGSLSEFARSFGIDLTALEQLLATSDLNIFAEVPVICALKRPDRLIGFTANIEFANFYLTITGSDKDKEAGTLRRELSVNFQAHNEPLTRQKAQMVAGGPDPWSGNTWVTGCGALGSKVVLHLARSGTTDLVLLDPDYLAPHNLVRHALVADYAGMNKAIALKKAITQLYPHEELSTLQAVPFAADILLQPFNNSAVDISRLLDFTASDAFLHTLVVSPSLSNTIIYRGVISDKGQLGILMQEGGDRNPRLDDLQVMLYAQAAKRPAIASWLAREAIRAAMPLVSVGVGCNSETTILADEAISTHAAHFAQVLRYAGTEAAQLQQGQIYLSRLSTDEGYPAITTERIQIEPLQVFTAVNDPGWRIRMVATVLQTIQQELVRAAPHETGGVLLGRADYKTKTIHVVEILLAPADSKANQVCFFRGIRNLPEQVAAMTAATGSQLGYIGEWHTHPAGPEAMSTTDHQAVQRFKAEFTALTTPLPVFLFIATSSTSLAFVY